MRVMPQTCAGRDMHKKDVKVCVVTYDVKRRQLRRGPRNRTAQAATGGADGVGTPEGRRSQTVWVRRSCPTGVHAERRQKSNPRTFVTALSLPHRAGGVGRSKRPPGDARAAGPYGRFVSVRRGAVRDRESVTRALWGATPWSPENRPFRRQQQGTILPSPAARSSAESAAAPLLARCGDAALTR
jgi:hypothetical protein